MFTGVSVPDCEWAGSTMLGQSSGWTPSEVDAKENMLLVCVPPTEGL